MALRPGRNSMLLKFAEEFFNSIGDKSMTVADLATGGGIEQLAKALEDSPDVATGEGPVNKDISGNAATEDKNIETFASLDGTANSETTLSPEDQNVAKSPGSIKDSTFAGQGSGDIPEKSNAQINAFLGADGNLLTPEQIGAMTDTEKMKTLYDLTGKQGNRATMEKDLMEQYNLAKQMYLDNRR